MHSGGLWSHFCGGSPRGSSRVEYEIKMAERSRNPQPAGRTCYPDGWILSPCLEAIPIDDCENHVSLRRTELPGGHLSLVRLADLSRGECGEEVEKRMLPAIFPHPVFSYARTNTTVAATAELLEPAFSMLNISGDLVFTSSPSARTED